MVTKREIYLVIAELIKQVSELAKKVEALEALIDTDPAFLPYRTRGAKLAKE